MEISINSQTLTKITKGTKNSNFLVKLSELENSSSVVYAELFFTKQTRTKNLHKIFAECFAKKDKKGLINFISKNISNLEKLGILADDGFDLESNIDEIINEVRDLDDFWDEKRIASDVEKRWKTTGVYAGMKELGVKNFKPLDIFGQIPAYLYDKFFRYCLDNLNRREEFYLQVTKLCKILEPSIKDTDIVCTVLSQDLKFNGGAITAKIPGIDGKIVNSISEIPDELKIMDVETIMKYISGKTLNVAAPSKPVRKFKVVSVNAINDDSVIVLNVEPVGRGKGGSFNFYTDDAQSLIDGKIVTIPIKKKAVKFKLLKR